MIEPTQDPLDYRFVIGLLTGTVVGAGLMLCFAPKTRSELRQRMTDSAEALGTRAADAYREVNAQVSGAVEDLARKGQSVRYEVADAVARGAHEVERLAVVGKTGAAAAQRLSS